MPLFFLAYKLVQEGKLSDTLTLSRQGATGFLTLRPHFMTDRAVSLDHIQISEISGHYFWSGPPESTRFLWDRKHEIADLNVFISRIYFTDYKTSIYELIRFFLNQKDFSKWLRYKLFKNYRINTLQYKMKLNERNVLPWTERIATCKNLVRLLCQFYMKNKLLVFYSNIRKIVDPCIFIIYSAMTTE